LPDDSDPAPAQVSATPRARYPVIVAVVWCGLIFASSCTVILPHDFFAWIAAHVLPDENSLSAFVIFWGFSWFAIVKGWHAFEFAVVFVLLQTVLSRIWKMDRSRTIGIAATIAILFAVSDEYHQTFVPQRGGTWTDVAIDSLGVLVAAWWQVRRRPRNPLPDSETSSKVNS
jgi:hypothetical protein